MKTKAFAAYQELKSEYFDGKNEQEWGILAKAVAEYVAPIKTKGMWIDITGNKLSRWIYWIRRRNGKGLLRSAYYYARRVDCIRTAKATAKQLGIEYRGVR